LVLEVDATYGWRNSCFAKTVGSRGESTDDDENIDFWKIVQEARGVRQAAA
jgi:hypothetical protein